MRGGRNPAVLLLAALAGCQSAARATEESGEGYAGSCPDPILVPTGNLQGEPVPADAHTETYGSDPSPFAVHLGLPTRDPSTSVSFLWRTDTATLATVAEVGPADRWPEDTTRIEGASFTFGGGQVGNGPYRIHEVRICDVLEPGTTYTYRVGGEQGWSAAATFTTPRAPGTFDTFRVGIAGDSRGAYDTFGQILAAMGAHEPDFFLFSGDMVDRGGTQTEWDAWFGASGDVLARKLLLPAHGNHEFLSQNYFAQFGLPGNEQWYAVEWGDLLVLSLNDTVAKPEDMQASEPQFIETELAATTARWKLAMHHKPAYSTCKVHGSNPVVRDAWVPLFDRYALDWAFSGHNHLYERSLPIRNGARAEIGQGTQYVVSGGAGAPLYIDTEPQWFGLVANTINHYIIADFGPSGVDFTVYDLSGNTLDAWRVPR